MRTRSGRATSGPLTSRPSGGRLAVAALAIATALPAPTHALDVKLWPLFRYARDDERGLVRWSALGPLVEYSSTNETRDLRVRPFLWLRQRRGAVPDDRADVLYPLLATRWEEDYQSVRFLLFTYHARPEPRPPTADATPPPAAGWPSQATLFPFVFYHRTPERGTRLSVLPFYFDEENFFGYDEVKAVLFPAYVRVNEPGVERRFFLFPFVSTVGGPLGDGVRAFPFYGRTEIAGRERSSYVLWPFHLRSEQLVPDYGWERRRIDLPFFAAIDSEGQRTRAYGPFSYVHTVNTRRGYESTAAPWPLVVRERALGEEEYRIWRVFPFYGRSEGGGVSSRFYAWPAYRSRIQDVDDFHYERRDAGLVLWRSQSQENATSGHTERLVTAFPVLRSASEDARAFGQVPAMADSLLPRNRGVLALWAPLYAVVRWDTRPNGARDWNTLWGLVAREDERLLGPWHLDLGPPAAAAGSDGS